VTREREWGGVWDVCSPIHTVELRRGGRMNERGRIPPLFISQPILLPVSSCVSSCNPCVPHPMPPHLLLPSPQQLLMAHTCQCGTGTYLLKAAVSKVGFGVVDQARRSGWLSLVLGIRRGSGCRRCLCSGFRQGLGC